MSFKKKEPEKPKNVELWVESEINGTYCANRLNGVYETDITKAMKQLEKFLESRFPEKRRIIRKDIGVES